MKLLDNCEHKYIYMESKKRKDDRVFGAPEWSRTDYFYCEKCLDERNKVKYECGWEKPEWY